MSCDNIQGNGQRRPPDVHRVRPAARTPSSATGSSETCGSRTRMVDRITPVTTDEDRAEIRRAVRHRRPLAGGLRAVHPVGARGRLPAGPARRSSDVGVQLVADVEPYELMKLRLLNASHQALALLRLPGRLPAGRTRPPGPAVRAVPARLHGRGGDPDAARRCPGSTSTPTSTTLIERFSNPADPGHPRPAVRRELGPHPEMAAPGRSAQQLATGGEVRALGRGRGQLGALRRGRRRGRRADRDRRPAARTR